jgi:hypothetical protein
MVSKEEEGPGMVHMMMGPGMVRFGRKSATVNEAARAAHMHTEQPEQCAERGLVVEERKRPMSTQRVRL